MFSGGKTAFTSIASLQSPPRHLIKCWLVSFCIRIWTWFSPCAFLEPFPWFNRELITQENKQTRHCTYARPFKEWKKSTVATTPGRQSLKKYKPRHKAASCFVVTFNPDWRQSYLRPNAENVCKSSFVQSKADMMFAHSFFFFRLSQVTWMHTISRHSYCYVSFWLKKQLKNLVKLDWRPLAVSPEQNSAGWVTL